MISRQHQCIFIHVPKTAGQSVELFFLNLHGLNWNCGDELLLSENKDHEKGPQQLSHLTAMEYVSCGHIASEEFNQSYKFSFVRNPWARLVSEYRYHYDRKYSFRDFVLHGLPEKDSYSDAYRHIRPQTDFLFDREGTQLVDFIGRFENLVADFSKVCCALNLPSDTLPRINSNRKPRGKIHRLKKWLQPSRDIFSNQPYTAYYDDELHNIVEEMYIKDIQRFGYTFEGLENQ
jgi:hypothetical protein